MTDRGFLPASIVAGETIWIAAANTTGATNTDITLSGYLPADYSLSYQFAAASPITVSAVENGDGTGWTLEVTAAQTLAWKPGTVRFAGYATHKTTARVFAVDAGAVSVTPSPLATSTWTAVVTACDAAILTYAGNPNGSLSADGISISYRSLEDLVRLRSYAKSMADGETGGRIRRIIRTRFT